MRWTMLVGALGALLVAVPVQAQYGGMGGGMGDGMGGRGGMGRGGMSGPGGAPAMMISDEALDGPPTPGMMLQLLTLDERQSATYTRAWDSLMAETKVERDSAHAAVKAMRDGFSGGDRESARANAGVARRLAGDLAKRDQAFDASLKTLLTKDQRKEYDKWKDQNRKDAEAKQREQMRGREGGREGGRMGGGMTGGTPRF
ncbi:MAG: hypothetical protein ACM3OH_03000 [Bacillota bacterium]|jgi:hypothetical protein